MYSIRIVTHTTIGFSRASPGIDMIFFKKRSTIIKKKLLKWFNEKGIQGEVIVDDLEYLEWSIRNGTNLILISPYISAYFDFSEIDEKYYYIINKNDYLSGNIERIIETIERSLKLQRIGKV